MRNLLAAAFAAILALPAMADCPAPPPPQRDIIADSYYDDPPVYSHIDPARHAAYEAAVKPLEFYLGKVARMASDGDKACAVRWLVAWAEGDAMLGTIRNEQAHSERKWVTAGLALSYAKVRADATRDQMAAIDTWLRAVADGIAAHSDAKKPKNDRNNHYYWEGLAVGASGAVTGDQRQIAWARKVFDYAMGQIADDGSLPREMSRGGRALHYHLFAAAPLVTLESILDEHSAKLEKLVSFCSEGMRNPDRIAGRAGVPQIGILGDDADWIAIYSRHHKGFPAPKQRPFVTRLGGDLSTPNPLEHPY